MYRASNNRICKTCVILTVHQVTVQREPRKQCRNPYRLQSILDLRVDLGKLLKSHSNMDEIRSNYDNRPVADKVRTKAELCAPYVSQALDEVSHFLVLAGDGIRVALLFDDLLPQGVKLLFVLWYLIVSATGIALSRLHVFDDVEET